MIKLCNTTTVRGFLVQALIKRINGTEEWYRCRFQWKNYWRGECYKSYSNVLNRQPAFKIENVVTNKNTLELLLEWDMWPICVYKEVYMFFKKSFLYISKKRFNGYIILWIRSETKSTPKLNKLIFIARRLRHSVSNKYFCFLL